MSKALREVHSPSFLHSGREESAYGESAEARGVIGRTQGMTDGVDELNVLAVGFFLPVLLGGKYYGIGSQRPVYPIDRLRDLMVFSSICQDRK